MSKMKKDDYYMKIAEATALRGTCDRRQVGAVIVHDDRIISGGFNGAPRGAPECHEVGHLMVHGSCVRTVHAETNAIVEAGGAQIRQLAQQARGGLVTIYTTTGPCMGCMNLIINSHIQRIVYRDQYADASHGGDDRMAYSVEMSGRLGIVLDRAG